MNILNRYNLPDYSLSAGELILSPLVHPYALRHFEQGKKHEDVKWGQYLIGTIEICPVIGPILSTLEGILIQLGRLLKFVCSEINWLIFKFVFSRSPKQALSQEHPLSQIPSETIRQFRKECMEADPEKMRFKTGMIESGKNRSTERVKLSEKELQNLVETHKSEILRVFDLSQNCALAKEGGPGVNILNHNLAYVFELATIPGVIFKIPTKNIESGKEHQKQRVENAHTLKRIIEQNHLDRLWVPNCLFLDKLDNRDVSIVVEEKLPLYKKGNHEHQKQLYDLCASDPELRPHVNEYLAQLTMLTELSWHSDIKFDNIPLLSDGSGIGLPDTDHSGWDGTMELIECAAPDQFSQIEETAIKTTSLIGLVNFLYKFRYYEKERQTKFDEEKKLEAFHIHKHIVRGDEPITFDDNQLSELSEEEKSMAPIVIELLNQHIRKEQKQAPNFRRLVPLYNLVENDPRTSSKWTNPYGEEITIVSDSTFQTIQKILKLLVDRQIIYGLVEDNFATRRISVQC